MQKLLLLLLISIAFSLIALAVGLPILKKFKAKQEILSYVIEHKSKSGTPTMGGVCIMIVFAICSFIFFEGSNDLGKLAVLFTLAYAVIGLLDDYIKIKYRQNEGLKPYQKIIVQLALAVIIALFIYNNVYVGGKLLVPFTKLSIDINFFIIPLAIFIFLSVTNGANLTDGLDGLLTKVTMAYLFIIAIFIYLRYDEATKLGETLLMQEYGNLLVVCVALLGVLLAFLVFNCFPAKIFMGDTGSLALGACVACLSMFTRMSLFIPILGIIYVISCLSVIIQVGYFKFSHGKRVFLMAPYHHHLQKKGLSESRIGDIYALITLSCGILLLLGGSV
ncbi:MAG: phospho-N-acetylmuramoyl-pentapeptide-transferase [Clostridia bacterium]